MAKWLVKTEPEECSIDDFASNPDRPIVWEGVRNYQARNFLRQMREGDMAFIYHSSCKHIGIAGTACVATQAYPDPAQFNQKSPYFDAKSPRDNPRWDAVDMLHGEKFQRLLPLDELKTIEALGSLPLVKQGNRLSVMPVSEAEWQAIVKIANAKK